jgi:hypothetical protein
MIKKVVYSFMSYVVFLSPIFLYLSFKSDMHTLRFQSRLSLSFILSTQHLKFIKTFSPNQLSLCQLQNEVDNILDCYSFLVKVYARYLE